MKKKKISILVTCYNEEANLISLYKRVSLVFKSLSRYDFELIYIDNASIDNSERIFKKLSIQDRRIKVVVMSRNFGSPQSSFLAGFSYMSGEAAVLLHGDIQDPPEMIPDLIKKWEDNYQVVYGVRQIRKGYGFIWNFLYKAFYYVLNKLAYINIPLNAGEFSLIDKGVIEELKQIGEYDYYIRGLRAYVGFRQIGIPYVRESRTAGGSTENLLTSIWWAKTIIINFSFRPLEWISIFGFIVMLFAFLFLVTNLVLLMFVHDSPRGIPTVVVLTLFLGGVQLLSLSIIAEYISKIFLEVKRRPKYIVGKVFNLKKHYAGNS